MLHTVWSILHLCAVITIGTDQQCLSSPPELEWSCIGTVCTGKLDFVAETFTIPTDPATTFTTRVYDHSLPGPTMKLKRGYKYELTYYNTLPPESADNPSGHNILKDPQTTNLHTHGLHISGEAPSDSVFDIMKPNENYIYEWLLPCDHSGGLHWYHPHHHGSTTVQVGGGAYGAIIVEDDAIMENLPNWYTIMDELVMVIGSFDLRTIANLYSNNIDELFKTNIGSSFYLINGEYKPTICIQENKWIKLRILHVDIANNMQLHIDSNYCQIYLLAKDGVIIHGEDNITPRLIASNKLYFSVSSRADIAISCSKIEKINIIIGQSNIIGYIDVSQSNENNLIQLTPFHPTRPRYLESLLNYDGEFQQYDKNGPGTDSYFSVNLGARTTNGQSWNGPDDYLVTVDVDTVNEWHIKGSKAHPFHIHANHFQLISGGDVGEIGWTQPGDWIDTLAEAANVRFKTDTFGGHVVLHCHILKHEDEGAMAVMYINGGCDAEMQSFGEESNCNPPQCSSNIMNKKILPSDNIDPINFNNNNTLITYIAIFSIVILFICISIGIVYRVYSRRDEKKILTQNNDVELLEYGTCNVQQETDVF
eukprot:271139_1